MPELPPIEMAGWLASLFFFLGLMHKLMQVTGWGPKKLTTIAPQPLVVEMQKHMATKEELAKLEIDVDKKFDIVTHRVELLSTDSDKRARKLHERIEGVLKTCSETKGEIKKIGENVQTLLNKAINDKK